MIGAFFASLTNRILAGAIAALVILTGIFWFGWGHAASARDKAREELRTANAQIALLKTDATLKETASKERQVDVATTDRMEKDLVNAIKTVPDSAPDAVRVRLGCERLRKAGRLDADLPVVCRSGR